MTYAKDGLIAASDYNTRVWGTATGTPDTTNSVACVNRFYGIGYGNKGLGQDMTSVYAGQANPNYGELYPVTKSANAITQDGSRITAIQWVGLLSAINRVKYHQTSGNLSVAVHPGDKISTVTALDAAISSCETNMGKGLLGSRIAGSVFTDNWSSISSASTLTYTVYRTITFSSPERARWFFNAGGYLRIVISASDQSGGVPRSQAMAQTINALGSCNIDANGTRNTGFSGLGTYGTPFTAQGKGYWQLGPNNGYSNYVSLGGYLGGSLAGVYSDDFVTCGVYFGGTQDANGDNGDTLYVRFNFSSGYGDTGPGGLTPTWQSDSLNINIATTIDAYQPSTNVLANSWGTPYVG